MFSLALSGVRGPGTMATNCGNCGMSVEPFGPALRARNGSHLHFSGTCAGCGRALQWHQTVIGFVGPAHLLGPARSCPSRCKHRDPAALGPSRRWRVPRSPTICLFARQTDPPRGTKPVRTVGRRATKRGNIVTRPFWQKSRRSRRNSIRWRGQKPLDRYKNSVTDIE